MQVHYNLLAGDEPDSLATQIRWRRRRPADLTALHTILMPARSSCRAGPSTTTVPLCDREAAVEDAKERFGEGTGQLANAAAPALRHRRRRRPTTTVVHPQVNRPMTILGAAGHMHLLGQWIKIEANPGTPDAGRCSTSRSGTSTTRAPSRRAGPPRRRRHRQVTCHHVQELRDLLPAFEGQPGEVRRLGRGHHRRDVPRHAAGRSTTTGRRAASDHARIEVSGTRRGHQRATPSAGRVDSRSTRTRPAARTPRAGTRR